MGEQGVIHAGYRSGWPKTKYSVDGKLKQVKVTGQTLSTIPRGERVGRPEFSLNPGSTHFPVSN